MTHRTPAFYPDALDRLQARNRHRRNHRLLRWGAAGLAAFLFGFGLTLAMFR